MASSSPEWASWPQVSFLTQSLMGAPKLVGRQAPGSTGGVPASCQPGQWEGEESGGQAGQAWAGSGRQKGAREQSQPCAASREQCGVAQPH